MNIKYISLGASCATIYQINKHIGNSQTLFFDWLITNQLIDIIELFNNHFFIDNIINDQSITILEEIGDKRKVKFNKLKNLFSVHDLPKDYTSSDIICFVDKTKERFNRFIDQLLFRDQLICLLRIGKDSPSYDDQQNLYSAIKKINPKIQLKLIFITYGAYYSNSIDYNESIINITLHENILESNEWTLNHLDWKFIFTSIEEHINGIRN